jgi:HK97 family phage major capsid protein
MNPADMSAVRLAEDTTGNYFYGPPSMVGPNTMWGLPIATSTQVAAGYALVGDFTQATLWTREGINVTASSEHQDFFIKNMVAILGEGRFAFGVRTPKAFCLADIATP